MRVPGTPPTDRQAPQRPTCIDLYAGAGGLSLGVEQAGFEVLAAAELDPIHALTHRYNMPTAKIVCGDLGSGSVSDVAATLHAAAALQANGLDALVGGPPCQGFSVGGVRDLEDERNNQFLRFVDLVVELQPKVFLLENVAGLLEPRFEPLRKEALRRLTAVGGYEVSGFEAALNAADFGVPQRRRRVLIIGSRVGAVPHLAPDGTAARTTVAEALEGLPDVAKYPRLLSDDQVELSPSDLADLRAVRSAYAQALAGTATASDNLSWPRAFDETLLTGSLRTVHKAKSVSRFRRTPQGGVEKVSRLYRLDPGTQARTLRAGTGSDRGSHTSPRPIHPDKNRVITVREAARIHGYPDWFRFHRTNWHGHRQIGNSVPPPFAAAAGRALMEALGIDLPTRPDNKLVLGDPDWLRMNKTDAVAELRLLGEIVC